MSKCIDWLKVGSYDGQWADTVTEDHQASEPTESADPPPLSRSLRVLWAIVLGSWVATCLGLAFYNATRG